MGSSEDLQSTINKSIDDLDTELRSINRKIHENPELGYQEFQAHDNITALLRTQGLDVIPHAYGLETSFSVEYGSGGRVVTFNAEYDALPGIGHACGHNLIAASSIAAFLGTVAVLKKHSISGRVRLLGTPAEESGGGKLKLIKAGAYKDVDACLMTHPMGAAVMKNSLGHGIAYGTCVASVKFQATFTGKAAHAAAAPHEGINALDAAVLSYNGISMLRQQIKPYERIQGVILEGGDRPNIITPRSLLKFNVRSGTLKETMVLHDRVVNCFEGAAMATCCQVDFESENNYAELLPNRYLSSAYSDVMAGLDSPQICNLDEDPVPGAFSTDMGNVSHVCPGFHGLYLIPTSGMASNHTPEFATAAGTDEAHRLAMLTSKGMAHVACKVLLNDAFAKCVKEAFEKDKRDRDI